MSEEVRKVRCNWCMAIMDEEEIIIMNDEEYCPECGLPGYLMDLLTKEE